MAIHVAFDSRSKEVDMLSLENIREQKKTNKPKKPCNLAQIRTSHGGSSPNSASNISKEFLFKSTENYQGGIDVH